MLAKALSDGSVAVGMFNRGDQPSRMIITWESPGVGGKAVQARACGAQVRGGFRKWLHRRRAEARRRDATRVMLVRLH